MDSHSPPLTLSAFSAHLPVDTLAYVLLDDGSDDVAACLHDFEELLKCRHVHRLEAVKGARITDLGSACSSPLIVGVVNKMPIKCSSLPADLAAFCSAVEGMAAMLLLDPDSPPTTLRAKMTT